VSKPLQAIFQEATMNEPLQKKSPPSAADKEEAERLKTEGNNLMRTEKFVDALDMYSKAINLDGGNPVFYCNRAAAHSKMNNHHLAIEDCQRAIDMDPSYSKAYGRMGLAHSSLEKHREAVENFKKALELEPDNESYKSNLQIAEDKVKSGVAPSGGMGGMFPGMGGPGGMDLSSFLNNPALMNMATTMLQDPNMQAMMGQMMGGQGGVPGGPAGPGGPPPDMASLLQAGQQLAQQMQQSNPELVEQLRRPSIFHHPVCARGDQSARVGKILRRFYVATLWFLDSPRKLRCYAIAFHDPYEIYSCPHTLLNIDFHSSVDSRPYI